VTTSPQAQEQAAHQLSQAINRRMSKPIQQMQDMLADAKKVGVIAHVHPDADAIGAASAMVMALVQRGISAVASYGESDLPAKVAADHSPDGNASSSTRTWMKTLTRG